MAAARKLGLYESDKSQALFQRVYKMT